MNFLKKSLTILAIFGSVTAVPAVQAEACTYNEALMAFKKGNTVRGQALLTMAMKDGDRRAVALFAELQKTIVGENDVQDVLRVVQATIQATTGTTSPEK